MKAKKIKRHTSHRPGKYKNCAMCMGMLAANSPKLSEKLGILTGITIMRDDRLPQPLLGEVQSRLRGFNHTPKDNYWKVKV